MLTPCIPFLACEQSIASGISNIARSRPQITAFHDPNDEKRHYSCPYILPFWTSTSSKMVTSSVVNCDRWTVLCLYSCRCTGLGHVCMIYRYANYKSNVESLYRSSQLEMALNTEASLTRTIVMFDMNGWCSLL